VCYASYQPPCESSYFLGKIMKGGGAKTTHEEEGGGAIWF
jgi:hypothetical protein